MRGDPGVAGLSDARLGTGLLTREASSTRSRRIRFLIFALWIIALGALANLASAPFQTATVGGQTLPNHWDFTVYKGAADLAAAGGNPLDFSQLKARGVGIPFNYSPAFSRATLWMFAGEYRAVELRFVAAKILAIVAAWAVLVWGLGLRGIWPSLTAVLLVFGFGSALLVDLSAGNITAFELLWTSALLVGATRRWDVLFLGALFLLCLGKPLWGIFSVVPLALHWDRRSLRSFLLGIGAFALPLVISFLVSPDGTRTYLTSAFGFRESGYINPAARELIGRIVEKAHLPRVVGEGLWISSALALIAFAMRSRSRRSGREGLAYGASLLLLLPFLLPRFKTYAFALLIPFVVLALSAGRPTPRTAAATVLVTLIPFLLRCDGALIDRLGRGTLFAFVGNFPLFLAGGCLLLLTRSQNHSPRRSFGGEA